MYMLKSVGDRTPPCGTFLNCRCVSEGGVCFASFYVVCDAFYNSVWDVCVV